MTVYRAEYAWAAAWSNGKPYPFIIVGTVGGTRDVPMEHMGAVWRRDGETIRQGWKRAYRQGCRLIRVRVCEAFAKEAA
jgi:hypothetical protein